MDFLNEAKYRFKYATPTAKLIIINVAVFVLLALIRMFLWMFKSNDAALMDQLALPSNLNQMITHPWTFVTYQFTHLGLMHLISNMILLNLAGSIFLDFFKKSDAWRVYIWGGVIAGFLFFISCNFIPAFGSGNFSLIGASGSAMAILFAVTTYAPRLELNLFGVFKVKLIWFSLFFLLLDIVVMPNSNPGGHIAHFGGALYGWLFANYRKGSIKFKLFEPVIRQEVKPKHMKVEVNQIRTKVNAGQVMSERKSGSPTQEEIDAILDKISSSGYERLSKEEKDILFKASQE